ncbi:benzoate/H(+) symporter BenE family transporter [Halobaculum magnesiiphilum]|uniref:Benzoate/H(+) symporter BenE family transporter n=1 Tax=Halobaculum magnesiiphilum TaxID=1017351 RepID=A0A8T8WH32_9EURY|nr:benzoate/H(+) symporter BenE family transporter [Halobaculum magnesiiphilum]QZP39161.1 benzoate/H(+) symporter BenE family transporter [Halobaculum magnesiiphilum]
MSQWSLASTLESGPGFREGIAEFGSHLDLSKFGAGLTAAVFGCTGPALIILNAANEGGLTNAQAVSWLFGIYVLGGLLTLGMALYYKQPIVGAWTIPGAVMVGIVLADFNFAQAAGAYLVSGILVFLIGISGKFRDLVEFIPQPIIMGMIAGVLIEFTIGIITAVQNAPLIAGVGLIGFLLFHRFVPKIPGIVGAIGLGIGAAIWQGSTALTSISISIAQPILVTPVISLESIITIAIPLTVMVIGAENMQAIGVLQVEDYDPPINSMLVFSGIGGMLASFVGGHNANIAGPMTAITSSEEAGEDREGRYVASVIAGVLFGAFGFVAAAATSIVNAVPGTLISLLAGVAMIGVLISAFEGSWVSTSRYQYGTFFALIIGMSGLSLFDIGAPFWSLIGGVLVSLILETEDWRELFGEDSVPDSSPTVDD